MKLSYLICAILISCASDSPIQTPQNRTDQDLPVLAGEWWGSSVAEFPKIAGLKTGEYSVTPDPIDPKFQHIMVARQVLERWVPKELPPLSFKFSSSEGLVEISGFYQGSQDEVLAILKSRYGEPVRGAEVIGMKAYGWDIGNTQLSLRHGIFNLNPRRQ